MPLVLAALRGRFGNNDYYVLSMKAEDLVSRVWIPAEMPEWHEATLEERWQRQINYERVKKDIAPYLVRDQDRFFGAVIVAAEEFDCANFEPISDTSRKSLNLYASEASSMGFLTLMEHERWHLLDGQHRIKALQFAIGGVDQNGNKIRNFDASTDVSNDDVVVILITYDEVRARKIFTKLNRYAKPTSTGENLVVDDDDIIAVTARLVASNVIGEDLVKYFSNTLSDNSPQFTTLANIAECNVAILESGYSKKIVRTKPVRDNEREGYEKSVTSVWQFLVNKIDLFRDALEDKNSIRGDDRRIEIRRDYILGKPVSQWCLVAAFMRLIKGSGYSSGKIHEAVTNLNRIDWRRENPLWSGLLLEGARRRILTKNRKIAARIIAYMAGENLGEEEEAKLLSDYLGLFPLEDQLDKELPRRVI